MNDQKMAISDISKRLNQKLVIPQLFRINIALKKIYI